MNTKLFGITEEELNSKLFNIFIGISLGNKYLSKESAEEAVSYAWKHTKNQVIVLIADEIDIINWEVYRDFSYDEASEKVKNKANGIIEMFNNVIKQLSNETGQDLSEKIKIITWSDIKTETFLANQKALSEEYKNNFEFKKRVLYFVEEYAKLRKEKTINQEEKDKLASYIISELPTLINGVEYNNDLYQTIFYLTYTTSGLSEFVLDIQNGTYQALSQKLNITIKGKMIESYLKNIEK